MTGGRAGRAALPRKPAIPSPDRLAQWVPVIADASLFERAWTIEDRFALSFWDPMIVAAAAGSGASIPLTEDLQEDAEFDGVRVVNPFHRDPGDERVNDR